MSDISDEKVRRWRLRIEECRLEAEALGLEALGLEGRIAMQTVIESDEPLIGMVESLSKLNPE